MSSLEDNLKRLTVNQSTEDASSTTEPSDRTASSGSMSTLDLFIRDLDEKKGKLPCCQEVVDIQTGVENVLKALLREVERENPFYKTTLINTGSYYEGTKAGQPDEFDYFVQLDNFSKPEDIRHEEMPHATVMVIPHESSFKKFRETNPNCSDFEWKKEVKASFVDLLNSKLAKGYEGHGIVVKASKRHMIRHGPAYSLTLKWQGGSRYMGMEISVDLSLAVKIHSHSSSMDIDFDSQAGKVVKSLLLPYYFAVSAYRERTLEVPQTKLFEEHENSNGHEVSVNNPSNCRLRVSQSCLEQSLFLHFGPDSGPSICLRVLKVLRDITQRPPPRNDRVAYSDCEAIDESVADFHRPTFLDCAYWWMSRAFDSFSGWGQDGNKWISSYALKSLVLCEWKENPDSERWSGSNLCQRLLSIIETLLHCLENKDKRLRSFFYRDYNILPRVEQTRDPVIRAINRIKIMRKSLLLLRNGTTYSFEECLQYLTDNAMLAWRKNKLTRFLIEALERIFSEKLSELWTDSVGKRNFEKERHRAVGLRLTRLLSIRSLCNIYLQCLINEISPEEELILTEPEEARRHEPPILKQARTLFKMMACGRMKMHDHLPSFCLWTQDLATHSREVGMLLQLICVNFKEDLEGFMNKLDIVNGLHKLKFK